MATSTIKRADGINTVATSTNGSGLTFNSKLTELGGYGTFAQKIGVGRKIVCVSVNFALKANSSLSSGETLVSGLPQPEKFISFIGQINNTAIRMQIHGDGTLRMDTAFNNSSSSVAYFGASVTYLAKSTE